MKKLLFIVFILFGLVACGGDDEKSNLESNDQEVEVTDPEVTDPEVTDPEVTDPEVMDPEVTDPEVTDPEVTDPEVTDPEVMDPEVTDPEVTDPEVTDPEVTDPEVTDPEVTDPEVTDPEVTDSEVTDPEVTDPEVTDPEVTDPEVTDPEDDLKAEIEKYLNLPPEPDMNIDEQTILGIDINDNKINDHVERLVGFALFDDEPSRKIYNKEAKLWTLMVENQYDSIELENLYNEYMLVATCSIIPGLVAVPDELRGFQDQYLRTLDRYILLLEIGKKVNFKHSKIRVAELTKYCEDLKQ